MNDHTSPNMLPFGLLELDATGTVIRYSPPAEQHINIPTRDILGHNFFRETTPVKQVGRFRDRFRAFMADGQPVDKFSFTFPTEQGQVKVQIMLAQITEKSEGGRKRLALVRTMPDAAQTAL